MPHPLDTPERIGLKDLQNGRDTAVSARTAAQPSFESSQRQVEVIENETATIRAERHGFGKLFQPGAGEVHGHLNFDQTRRLAVRLAARSLGLRHLVPRQAQGCGQFIDNFVANIVGSVGVLLSWVAQAQNDLLCGRDGECWIVEALWS